MTPPRVAHADHDRARPSRCAPRRARRCHGLEIAQDELRRRSRSSERCCARQGRQPNFLMRDALEVEPFLRGRLPPLVGDRPRRIWRLGSVAAGTLERRRRGAPRARCADREAVEHTPPDGTIEVSARPDGDFAVIEVWDDGTRIPPDALERIFRALRRADRANAERGRGSGCRSWANRQSHAACAPCARTSKDDLLALYACPDTRPRSSRSSFAPAAEGSRRSQETFPIASRTWGCRRGIQPAGFL